MQSLVKIMELHPNSKAVLNVGASILGKIATLADLNNALEELKKDSGKSGFHAALLS